MLRLYLGLILPPADSGCLFPPFHLNPSASVTVFYEKMGGSRCSIHSGVSPRWRVSSLTFRVTAHVGDVRAAVFLLASSLPPPGVSVPLVPAFFWLTEYFSTFHFNLHIGFLALFCSGCSGDCITCQLSVCLWISFTSHKKLVTVCARSPQAPLC